MDWSFWVSVGALGVAGVSLVRAFLADKVAKDASELSKETQRLQQEQLSRGLVDIECTGARRSGDEVEYTLVNNTRKTLLATALPAKAGANEVPDSSILMWRPGISRSIHVRDSRYGFQPDSLEVTYRDWDDDQSEEKAQDVDLPEPSEASPHSSDAPSPEDP